MIEAFGEYIAELKNFKSYLLEDSPNISTKLLGGVRTEHIIDSIDYNIKHNGYGSKSIASKYAIGIAQFYRHANQNNWFTNDDLLKKINAYKLDETSYYAQISNYIKNNTKLKTKQSKDTCSDQEVNEVITNIDYYFNIIEDISELSYPRLCSMLAIKLMLLTGAKYNVVRNLKFADLDTSLNTLVINNFKIRLPVKLSLQFQIFRKLRSHINLSSEFLFTTQTGDQWGRTTSNAGITDILSIFIMRIDTTGITKYGISNLLKAGIGIKEIEQLTGAKKDLIHGCISVDFESESDKLNNYINMRLATIDAFYKI